MGDYKDEISDVIKLNTLALRFEFDVCIFESDGIEAVYPRVNDISFEEQIVKEPIKQVAVKSICKTGSNRCVSMKIQSTKKMKYASTDKEHQLHEKRIFDSKYPYFIASMQSHGLLRSHTVGWNKVEHDNELAPGNISDFELIESSNVVLKLTVFRGDDFAAGPSN
ncbi:hypothetical protein ACH5RR_001715 [Cinchona calisaya]|uniref:Uncharacterized protein n=1 Tax=Cinchona calisaya TaxID=153742 RepID=A0ABD3B4A3_9GENT